MCKKLPGPAEEFLKGLRGEAPRGENFVFDPNERWFSFCVRRLWDCWQNPNTKERLRTCVIITGKPKRVWAKVCH
jgi:hypothetical protein